MGITDKGIDLTSINFGRVLDHPVFDLSGNWVENQKRRGRILREVLQSFRWGMTDEKVVMECVNGRTLLEPLKDKTIVRIYFLPYKDLFVDKHRLESGIVYMWVLSPNHLKKIKSFLLSKRDKIDSFYAIYHGEREPD